MPDGRDEELGLYLPEPARERMLPAIRPAVEHLLEEDDESISLHVYLQILSRRRWLVGAVAAGVLILAALQVFTTTPLYRSTAVIQIDPESDKGLPYREITDAAPFSDNQELIWTQAEKVQTRGLARRVIHELDLMKNPAFVEPTRAGALVESVQVLRRTMRAILGRSGAVDDEEQAIDRMLDRLTARRLPDTRLIELSYTSPDRELAAAIVNTLTGEFVEQNLESRYEATVWATDYLRTELEELKTRVEESEQELIEYAKAKNIVNLGERDTVNRKKLADLNDEVTAAEAELINQKARYFAAQRAGSESFPEILKNDAARLLETRLSELEQELAGLSARYGPEWPAVKEAHEKRQDIETQLVRERQRILSSARQEYELAVDRFNKLTGALEEQRSVVDLRNDDSIRYNILQREVETNKELYEGLLQRLKEAGIAAGLRSSNIRIADAAVMPRFADSPKKGRALALALILGLFLGIGTAFVAEALDNTIKTADDFARLGLPALGTVPHLEAGGPVLRRTWRFGRKEPEVPRLPVLAFEREAKRGGGPWEAYRSLRTAILLSHLGEPPETILVSSPMAGEGKTTTAANTAVALAQTGQRTVLVDLDLRKPSVMTLFGLEGREGMSNYLSGNAELSTRIVRTDFPNLFVIPSGPPAPNPSELIGSKKMDIALKLLSENFTNVVFDTPPVLEVTDALVLAPRVDGVMLVARSELTPRQALRRSAELFIRVGGQLLGVVLNDVSARGNGYGYYGYGGYGYGGYGYGGYGYGSDGEDAPADGTPDRKTGT